MPKKVDWKGLHAAGKVPWEKSDATLASEFGVRRQAVSAARERLGAPPSPAGHGGARFGYVGRDRLIERVWKLKPAQRQRVLEFIETMSS